MDLSLSTSLPDLSPAPRQAQAYRGFSSQARVTTDSRIVEPLPVAVPPSGWTEGQGTRLLKQTEESLNDHGGLRRTRTFEQEDGRYFTRIEDFEITPRGARRSVIQQNPSGAITQYEEILDREETGTFRRTQRFRGADGEIATHISNGYQVTDSFILTGGKSGTPTTAPVPFDPLRGTLLDLNA